MTDWMHELGTDTDHYDSWVADETTSQGLQFILTVAPSFDGRVSWFSFEEAVDDWLGITPLTQEQWAPSLKGKIDRRSNVIQATLGEKLKDPSEGLAYPKTAQRPRCVKSVESVFILPWYKL